MAKLKATPKSYADAVAVLKGKDSVRLGNNTYLINRKSFGAIAVRLHNTDIVYFWHDGRVSLQTGGYRTVTTKDRINQFITGYVFQKNYDWFYVPRQGAELPITFHEGLDVSQYYANPPLHLQERVVTDEPDFRIQVEGSIVILYALTDAAKQWVAEHIPYVEGETQLWGTNGIVVEPRYIGEIVDGISADGLVV